MSKSVEIMRFEFYCKTTFDISFLNFRHPKIIFLKRYKIGYFPFYVAVTSMIKAVAKLFLEAMCYPYLKLLWFTAIKSWKSSSLI